MMQLFYTTRRTGQSSGGTGQSMLETVLALGVILTGLLGSLTLIVATVTTGQVVEGQIVAGNLGREGVEVVRQIRDSNWIKIERGESTCGDGDDVCGPEHWDDGLADALANDYTGIVTPPFVLSGGACDTPDGQHYELQSLAAVDLNVDTIDESAAQVYQYNSDVGTDTDSQGSYVQAVGIAEGLAGDFACRRVTPYFRLLSLFPICYDSTPPGDQQIVSAEGIDCLDFGVNYEKIGIQVLSVVQWVEHGRTHVMTIEDQLFNWKQ